SLVSRGRFLRHGADGPRGAIAGMPDGLRRRLEFAYDYLGRRIEKRVYGWTPGSEGSGGWSLVSTRRFIYDGWLLIAELDGDNHLLRSYAWGLDASVSWKGAGGVGGLLAIHVHDPSDESLTATYWPAYDGGGNVVALVDADSHEVVARYKYAPYG